MTTQAALEPDAVELLATRIAELLATRLAPPTSTPTERFGRLLSAKEVSEWWGVSRGWVYQHARELGAVRIGDGERPRLRFDADVVAERFETWPATRPVAPRAPRRAPRSARLRRDSQRLAFRADPELSSSHPNRRRLGSGPTAAAAPEITASAR
jgi:hypothetical protein